jgi:hypothetical protein
VLRSYRDATRNFHPNGAQQVTQPAKQENDVKALCMRVLERNRGRNYRATKGIETAQLLPLKNTPKVAQDMPPHESEYAPEYWGRKIEYSTRKAMQQDKGALAYCELFTPLLHRRYMKAANNLDAAYTAQCGHDRAELVTGNVTGLKEALREHDRAAEQTRKAAAQPLTADQLTPAECARFCQAHLSDKGWECSYLNQLNGCTLWNAKSKRRSISNLPVSPTRYLEAHQREEP